MTDYTPGWWRIADAQYAERLDRADMAQMDEPVAPRQINGPVILVWAALILIGLPVTFFIGDYFGRVGMKAITEINAIRIEAGNAHTNAD